MKIDQEEIPKLDKSADFGKHCENLIGFKLQLLSQTVGRAFVGGGQTTKNTIHKKEK